MQNGACNSTENGVTTHLNQHTKTTLLNQPVSFLWWFFQFLIKKPDIYEDLHV